MSQVTPPRGTKPKKVNKKGDTTAANKPDNTNQLDNSSDEIEISLKKPGTVAELEKHFKQLLNNKITEIEKHFGKQITALTAEVDTLRGVINDKNQTIGKLQNDISELKNTCNFLTDETCNLGGKIKVNQAGVESSSTKYNALIDKTSDLEDRSRRNNVVFFNIPEPETTGPHNEDCEQKVKDLLHAKNFFEHGYDIPIDRAHRLGRKKDNDSRPRPLIVRFTYFKDKDYVIRNGYKLKDSEVNMSQDFSKITLDIHKQLRMHAKSAQEALTNDKQQEKMIKNIKVTYRRVVLTYSSNRNNPNAPVFTKSFTLQYILGNNKWYMPPKRNAHSNVQAN